LQPALSRGVGDAPAGAILPARAQIQALGSPLPFSLTVRELKSKTAKTEISLAEARSRMVKLALAPDRGETRTQSFVSSKETKDE
jgi:hypothetical protein